VFDKESEKLIGYCGLQLLDDTEEIEIYYGFHKDFWGKGLATEAAKVVLRFGFEEVKLPRIVAVTHSDNTDSQKVLLRLGMKQGKNDRFYDMETVYFSILWEDYQNDEAAFYKLDLTEI